MVESLFEKLDSNPNINKKELHLVVAGIYERADRLNDASRIMNRMNQKAIRNHDHAQKFASAFPCVTCVVDQHSFAPDHS